MELNEFIAYVDKVRSDKKELTSKHPKARLIIAKNVVEHGLLRGGP